MAPDSGAAACAVINTTELLEQILSNLDMHTLLCSQQVSCQFKATIDGSATLQRALWFMADPRTTTSIDRLWNLFAMRSKTPAFRSHIHLPFGYKRSLRLIVYDVNQLAKEAGSWRKMIPVQLYRPQEPIGVSLHYPPSDIDYPLSDSFVLRYDEAPTFGQMVDDMVAEHFKLTHESCPLDEASG
ncbi:hypothetical protein LTR36_004303 [Oleoguttula mirabilis]|uniref:F-box domain-containing protein n=1 Tax=Oleoguttula mirabilis TaxID=1507867 RepID=A0AAV9JHR8_9PEZI|nr:hypothetical protein LTR36_004303 [Oleoguttula mirabilis]